jgi:AraC-like DNA-binding protein
MKMEKQCVSATTPYLKELLLKTDRENLSDEMKSKCMEDIDRLSKVFNANFKKLTGMSPREYRRGRMANAFSVR